MVGKGKTEDLGQGLADVGVADRRGILETALEVGADRGHEVYGIGAAEAAVLPLSLLQRGVGQQRGPLERVFISVSFVVGGEAAEVYHDGGRGHDGGALEIDGTERQRAVDFTECVVDENPADVVLLFQGLNHARSQLRVVMGR